MVWVWLIVGAFNWQQCTMNIAIFMNLYFLLVGA